MTVEAQLAAVDRYIEMSRPEQALQALAALPGEIAGEPEIRRLRAIALLMQEDHERAADEAREALRDAPDDPALLHVLSAIEAQRGNLGAAEAAILAALRERPDSPSLLCQYAELLMRGAQLEKAGKLVDAAAAIDPEATEVLERRVELAYLRADDKQVRRHGEQLLARDPSSALGQRMLGVLDFNRGSMGRAAERLGDVVRDDPTDEPLAFDARRARAMRGPLWWPTRFFTRYGVWKPWVVHWVIVVALIAAGLGGVAILVIAAWVLLCVWSWVVPPILARIQGIHR